MYQKIVEQHRKADRTRMTILVLVMIVFALIAFFAIGGDSVTARVLHWGIPAILIVILAVEYKGYLSFDRDLEKMKHTVNAHSDFEMSRIMENSVNLDNCYFISDLYVLDFVLRKAVVRSEITRMENYEETHSDSDNHVTSYTYCIRIHYGDRQQTRLMFPTAEKRIACRRLLES